MSTRAGWRHVLGVAVVAAAPVVVAWTTARWRDRLPDPMPTHWSGRLPDSFTAYGTFTTQLLAATVLAAAVAAAVHAVPRADPPTRRATVGVAGGCAGLFLGVWLATAAAAWGSTDAGTVALGWWVLLAPAGLAVGAGAAWLGYGPVPRPIRSGVEETDLPHAALPDGARAVWVRRMGAPLFAGLAALVVAGAGTTWLLGGPAGAALGLLGAAALLTVFGSVRVVVDRHGLTVSSGVVGWPRRTFELARIERADAITLRPVEWGGWGYRVLPGRSAVVLRGGEALVVDLTDGRQFAVTVDDAVTAAGLLNSLRGLAAGARGTGHGGA